MHMQTLNEILIFIIQEHAVFNVVYSTEAEENYKCKFFLANLQYVYGHIINTS